MLYSDDEEEQKRERVLKNRREDRWKKEFKFKVTKTQKKPPYPAGGEAYLYPTEDYTMGSDMDQTIENIPFNNLLNG